MKTSLRLVLLVFVLPVACILPVYAQDKDPLVLVNGRKCFTHKVLPGEYWYALSKKYNISYGELRALNSSVTGDLSVGQAIYLPYQGEKPMGGMKKDTLVPAAKKANSKITGAAARKPIQVKVQEESGLAALAEEEDKLPADKYYALHKTAPAGGIIRITNPDNGKTVFVKVVGMLEDTDENVNVIIRITPLSARKIDFTGERCRVELNYSAAE